MDKLIENFDKKLDEFADLFINHGLQLKKGHKLLIEAQVDNKRIAYKCLNAAYEAGASDVVIDWISDYVDHARMKHADDLILDSVQTSDFAIKNEYIKKDYALLHLASEDPTLVDDIDPDRVKRFSQNNIDGLSEFLKLRRACLVPWMLTRVPRKNWAQLVYPDKSGDEALASLWNAIFEILEINGDGKAGNRWEKHAALMKSRSKMLNDYHFKFLHYTNSLGTDLYVELPEQHKWIFCGESFTQDGREFVCNMPTEEVYTSPLRTGVNGVVYSSMPLILSNTIIKGLRFELKDGKIISVHADKGEDIVKNDIKVNKNAEYFGEIALVPYDSQISNQNTIFYDALYDENASCHIAYGNCVVNCVQDWRKYKREDFENMGLNFSTTHVDFMVGTRDLSIIGTTYDGTEVPIFVNGNFAF